MKITKRFKATIPTVQYGNVDVETVLEWDESRVPSKTDLLVMTQISRILDNRMEKFTVEYIDTMEAQVDRVSHFGDTKRGKKSSTKELLEKFK